MSGWRYSLESPNVFLLVPIDSKRMLSKLQRGVNIEGWLWDLDRPPGRHPILFQTGDAERVASLGFDHIRINVNEQHLWDDAGEPRSDMFGRVDRLLDTCMEFGLNAVLDLHILRSHDFNAPSRPLFRKEECVVNFLDCWRKLSARFRTRPNEMLAYEFLNEPVADDARDWNRVSTEVHTLLRALEPERTLVLGSNGYSGPGSFPELAVPNDRNLVLTFHYYHPFLVTHYAVAPQVNSGYRGPIHYPGHPIDDEDFAALSSEDREALGPRNLHYDPDVMADEIRPALEVAARHGLPLYCGEWGCYDTVPRATRLRWHSDMVSIFEEMNIGWAAYAYADHWAVVRGHHGEIDKELIGILTGSPALPGTTRIARTS